MDLLTGHHAVQGIDAATLPNATATVAQIGAQRPADCGLLAGIDAAQRMRLELIARASASPQAALPHAVAVLVDGPAEQQVAIVQAFTDTEPLRAQWQRAWNSLRS